MLKLHPKNDKCFSTLTENEPGIKGTAIPYNIPPQMDPYGNIPFKNVQLTRSVDLVTKCNQVSLTRALLVSPEK